MLKSYGWGGGVVGWGGGGPCDFSVSPSPFGPDFGTLNFGTSDLGLTIPSIQKSVNDRQTDMGNPKDAISSKNNCTSYNF